MEWLITDILELICGNDYLLSFCTEGLEQLEVIIKLDAFPVSGGSCFLMTLTLGNFGIACKQSWLHFIAAIASFFFSSWANSREDDHLGPGEY